MKTICTILFLLFLVMLPSRDIEAQKKKDPPKKTDQPTTKPPTKYPKPNSQSPFSISVSTYIQCQVALFKEEKSGTEYDGWWLNSWHERRESGELKNTPVTFSNLQPGQYVLVVYDPSCYDRNLNRFVKEYNSIVIKNINIDGYNHYNFFFNESDFKEWNCLSCPWLYVYDGTNYIKLTEVIKDVIGEKNCKTDEVEIPVEYIKGNELKFLLKEEKEEISYIDGISLLINGVEVFPKLSTTEKVVFGDGKFLTLKQGESIEVNFDIDSNIAIEGKVYFKIRGYYEPEKSFVQRYLGELR